MDDISASKNCNYDADSDSSEDLPALPVQSFDIKKLQRNDIVLAEYKNIYWPAIVRQVDKKGKKISVWYCDCPGKAFKIPFRKIRPFQDMELRNIVKEIPPDKSDLHMQVVGMAVAYNHRRFMGKCDDPISFFDTSTPFRLPLLEAENFTCLDKIGSHSIQESENEGNNISATQSESKISSNQENDASSSVEIIDNEISEKCEDSDSNQSIDRGSLVGSDRENPVSTNCYDLIDDGSNDLDEKTADAVVSCIKSGCVDKYLLDIHRGKIKSKNQDIFNQAKEARDKDILWNCSSSVEIAVEKMKDVAHYLKDLYDRRVKKKKKDILWGETDYIVTVWTYDAIDKAMSLIESEPSKYFIDSNSANCSGSSNEHPSLSEDHDNLNGKRKSPGSNVNKPEGKEVCRKSSPKKTNAKKTTKSRKSLKNINKKNYVATSMSLRSSKVLDKTNSDVSTECEKKWTVKPGTLMMGTLLLNFSSQKG
ncbi:uncharacterized protein TNIN_488061 [Trichonephila inaurata madagascariensis]|uniref:Uncharacterized protein n=1 Tax=Trichonephila inaurata madagascariensis TaxID=2747483 RepID=A0A8X6XUL5_9ARAC|nr:uncharacterized protein TNIN_488061 [Trichonephila inaurata madagascariensis]